MYDLIIIGAGPAGITASVYAARKRMNFLVITKDIGGQAALSGDVENYTGYQFITGPELVIKFEEHMRKFDITLKENEEVIELTKVDNVIYVKTNKDNYHRWLRSPHTLGKILRSKRCHHSVCNQSKNHDCQREQSSQGFLICTHPKSQLKSLL